MANVGELARRGIIEGRLCRFVSESSEISRVPAVELVSLNRFDLAIKLAYLDLRGTAPEFARSIYDEHILAFGLGRYHEPEKPHKVSLPAFLDDFETIYNCIQSNGFDPERSLVPLATDGTILNGAHRVASAIHCQQDVATIQTTASPSQYTFEFFAKRGVSDATLSVGLESLLKHNERLRIGIVWPRASATTMRAVAALIPSATIIAELKPDLAELAAIVRQVYQGERWLGSPEDGYRGAFAKASHCLAKGKPLTAFVFDPQATEGDGCVKQRVRDSVGVDKHCLHTTDGVHDSLWALHAVRNSNYREFARVENRTRFRGKDLRLAKMLDILRGQGVDTERVCIVGGAVLEILGVRAAADYDLVALDASSLLNLASHGIDVSQEKLGYMGVSAEDLVLNPRNHFVYNGVKFSSLAMLRSFYQNRSSAEGDPKDAQTIALLPQLGPARSSRTARINARVYFAVLNARRNLRKCVVRILRSVGLFSFVKSRLGR